MHEPQLSVPPQLSGGLPQLAPIAWQLVGEHPLLDDDEDTAEEDEEDAELTDEADDVETLDAELELVVVTEAPPSPPVEEDPPVDDVELFEASPPEPAVTKEEPPAPVDDDTGWVVAVDPEEVAPPVSTKVGVVEQLA